MLLNACANVDNKVSAEKLLSQNTKVSQIGVNTISVCDVELTENCK